ncbi:MAG: hypothetical protein ACOVQT_11560 [Rubrivivax sp.]|jgi:hypothetical protein
MSYVLQIWSFPVPQSVAQAAEILNDLNQRPAKPQTQFLELARRLTARHPCITTLDDEDERAVWADGPLDGRTDRPVWSVGVLSAHVADLMPFVVETATSLGFVVYDNQAAACHLPGGTTLLSQGRRVLGHHLGMPLPEALQGPAIRTLLQQTLESAVSMHGFRFEPSSDQFVRLAGEWTHRLTVHVQAPEPGATGRASQAWRCDVELVWGHVRMARMWNELDRAAVLSGEGSTQKYPGSARTTFSRLAFFGRKKWATQGVRRGETVWTFHDPDELRATAVALREQAGTAMVQMTQVIPSIEQLALWCLSDDPQAWRALPQLRSTPSGLEKETVKRWLLDTEGCGGPVTLLILGAVSDYPEMNALLVRCLDQARQDASGVTVKRVERAARALRDGGLLQTP